MEIEMLQKFMKMFALFSVREKEEDEAVKSENEKSS
jgi:hypothetical protein